MTPNGQDKVQSVHRGAKERVLAHRECRDTSLPRPKVDTALKAVQLHGGNGYMEEFHIEKLARDAKWLELGAGTTHINDLTAARALLALA